MSERTEEQRNCKHIYVWLTKPKIICRKCRHVKDLQYDDIKQY